MLFRTSVVVMGLAAGVALASGSSAQAQSVAATPPPNVDASLEGPYPARRVAIAVPSHGVALDGRLLLAAGTGPHPTLIMLDGLPGWDNVLDIDLAVRASGWNVLIFRYRGAWGAAGTFSVQHSVEDASAALAYLRRPDIAAKYGIDMRRIVLAGHSMGGFCALAAGRRDHRIAGMVLIDPWNVGGDAKLIAATAKARADYYAGFDDLGHALEGATAKTIGDETLRHAEDWDYVGWAADLAGRPILLFGGDNAAMGGNGPEVRALSNAIDQKDGRLLKSVIWPTDHYFTDRRSALSEAILAWLATVKPVAP